MHLRMENKRLVLTARSYLERTRKAVDGRNGTGSWSCIIAPDLACICLSISASNLQLLCALRSSPMIPAPSLSKGSRWKSEPRAKSQKPTDGRHEAARLTMAFEPDVFRGCSGFPHLSGVIAPLRHCAILGFTMHLLLSEILEGVRMFCPRKLSHLTG